MARTFNGTSERVGLSIGACGIPLGPSTEVLIARKNSNNSFNYACPFGIGVDDNSAWYIWCNLGSGTQVAVWNGSTDTIAPFTWSSSEGWCLIAATKASGTAVIRFHKYVFNTGTWTHQDSSTTAGNSPTPATSLSVGVGPSAGGGFSGWFDGDVAAAALWNVVLTDDQIEGLALSLQPWFQVAPKGLWVFDQSAVGQKVVDLSGGGANESSIVGTSIASTSVPVFNYADGVWLPTKTSAGGSAIVLDAVLAGSGGIAPDLRVGKPFAVSLAGMGGIAADVKVGKPLAATLAGTSSASGDLTVGGGVVAAVLSALGGIAADLRVGKPLAAVVSATSSAVGDLRVGKALSASLAGTSAAAADLRVGKPLAALLSATSTVQADLRIGKPLAALLAGACTIAAALTVGAEIVGDKMRMRRGSGI